jgi:hypothetical protein
MTTRPTIRRLPCPAPDPPFDDEIGIRPDTRPAPAIQGALALAFMLPTGVPAEPEAPANLRLVDDPSADTLARRDEPDPFVAEFTARRPTSGEVLPEPRRWSARLAQAIVETLHGHRPVQQLLRWTDDAVYTAITNRLASRPRATPRARPTVRSIRVCTPTDGVAEASAVIQTGHRCRAIAMRLEGLDGQWRCTALEII